MDYTGWQSNFREKTITETGVWISVCVWFYMKTKAKSPQSELVAPAEPNARQPWGLGPISLGPIFFGQEGREKSAVTRTCAHMRSTAAIVRKEFQRTGSHDSFLPMRPSGWGRSGL